MVDSMFIWTFLHKLISLPVNVKIMNANVTPKLIQPLFEIQPLFLCVSYCCVSLLHWSEFDSLKQTCVCLSFWTAMITVFQLGNGMKADRWRDTNRKPCWYPVCQTPLIRVQTLTGPETKKLDPIYFTQLQAFHFRDWRQCAYQLHNY